MNKKAASLANEKTTNFNSQEKQKSIYGEHITISPQKASTDKKNEHSTQIQGKSQTTKDKAKVANEKTTNGSDLSSDVEEFTKNLTPEFKEEIKSFINVIVQAPRLEFSSKESDAESKQKLTKAMQDFTKSAKTWVDKNIPASDSKDDKIVGKKLDIARKFPKEMRRFTLILNGLESEKDKDKQSELLRSFCTPLELDYKTIKDFFDSRADAVKQKKEAQQLKPAEFSTIEFPQISHQTEEGIKSIESLYLEDGMSVLKSDYLKVQEHYNRTWKNKTAQEVNSWAKERKGKLTKDGVFEAIAVLDRANELVTGGHKLRDTQILSVLSFLQTAEDKGKLCQIKTGEGKTTIVSLFAAIKALQGESVDVITSNQVLAKEGVEDKANFYALLSLSVSHNNADERYIDGPKDCYTADILYGCIGNFQFDYLKDAFRGLDTRAGRKFDNAILDEVDNMVIDNGSSIAKLSGPFPGMECFRYIYFNIWKALCDAEKDVLDINSSEVTTEQINEIKSALKGNKERLIDINFFSSKELEEYAKAKLDIWIDRAIDARFRIKENCDYIIKRNSLGEEQVVPVDYVNTGVTLKNTIWSDGLHQFVQLKHNLYVTSESLTSSFISNKGYIGLYKSKVFGLTGTLGSISEQGLLSNMFHLDYAKIPTYKESKLKEDDVLIIREDSWAMTVFLAAIEKIDEGRAVLVICNTIQDLLDIKKVFDDAKTTGVNVKTYKDESESYITQDKVERGDVIIATNISGRGTDLKTTSELDKNGGLHVCISFLPSNQRIEDQAKGRTARQGKEGSVGIIVREGDLHKVGIDAGDVKKIKEIRNTKESERIEEVKAELSTLDFKDALFECFRKTYRKLKDENKNKVGFEYILKDLEEQWAFWFYDQEKNKKFSANADVESKFAEFTKMATGTIENHLITHNPYYIVLKAHLLIEDKSDAYIKEAKSQLEAIGTEHDLSAVYENFFDIHIQSGSVLTERFVKAIANLVFIGYEADGKYKSKAKTSLNKAKEGNVKKERDYLEKKFFAEQAQQKHEADEPWEQSDSTGKNGQEQQVKEDLFLKQLSEKYCHLNYILENIKKLIEQIDKSEENGIAISNKLSCLESLHATSDKQKLKNIISSRGALELSANGLKNIYLLKEIKDVPNEIVIAAQAQISAGLAALAAGLAFPPSLPIMGEVAGVLIGEGCSDIVCELLAQGSNEFDGKAYAKAKAQSILISACTMGIGAAAAAIKGLKAAEKTFSKVITTIAKEVLQDTAMQSLNTLVVNPALSSILDLCKVKESVAVEVRKTISANIDKEKIKHAKHEDIDYISQDILDGEIISNIYNGVITNLASSSRNVQVKTVGFLFNISGKVAEIFTCSQSFCTKMNDRLKDGNQNNNVELIIEQMSALVTGHIYNVILGVISKTMFTLPKLLKGAYKDYKLNKLKPSHELVLVCNNEENKIYLENYEQLGLKPGASPEEVRSAVKKMLFQLHPDKLQSLTPEESKMKESNFQDLMNNPLVKNARIGGGGGYNPQEFDESKLQSKVKGTHEERDHNNHIVAKVATIETPYSYTKNLSGTNTNHLFGSSSNDAMDDIDHQYSHLSPVIPAPRVLVREDLEIGYSNMRGPHLRGPTQNDIADLDSHHGEMDDALKFVDQHQNLAPTALQFKTKLDVDSTNTGTNCSYIAVAAYVGAGSDGDLVAQSGIPMTQVQVSGGYLVSRGGKVVCSRPPGPNPLFDQQPPPKGREFYPVPQTVNIGTVYTIHQLITLYTGRIPQEDSYTINHDNLANDLRDYLGKNGRCVAVANNHAFNFETLNGTLYLIDTQRKVSDRGFGQLQFNDRGYTTDLQGSGYLRQGETITLIRVESGKMDDSNWLEGLSTHNYTNIGYIDKYWGKYTLKGIAEILQLRLDSLILKKEVEILEATFVDKLNNNILLVASKIAAAFEENSNKLILVPLNLFNKHAVGLILEFQSKEKLKITFIDPSNQAMPAELKDLLYSAFMEVLHAFDVITIQELEVEQQRYANCGPEVIEGFIYYLTGIRVTQEKAVELHSILVESQLICSKDLNLLSNLDNHLLHTENFVLALSGTYSDSYE